MSSTVLGTRYTKSLLLWNLYSAQGLVHRSNEYAFNLIRYWARKEWRKEIIFYMEMPGKRNEARKRVKQTSREAHCMRSKHRGAETRKHRASGDTQRPGWLEHDDLKEER